jgi:hypothetical protein
MKVVEKLWIFKLGSVHIWYFFHPKKLPILQEQILSFHEVWSTRLLQYNVKRVVLRVQRIPQLPKKTLTLDRI